MARQIKIRARRGGADFYRESQYQDDEPPVEKINNVAPEEEPTDEIAALLDELDELLAENDDEVNASRGISVGSLATLKESEAYRIETEHVLARTALYA